MSRFKRIFLVVLDSVGIGAAPDAGFYNDQGADTLGRIAEEMNGLHMPHVGRLGLSNIKAIQGIDHVKEQQAHYTKMQEDLIGKDTMEGDGEIMVLHIKQYF